MSIQNNFNNSMMQTAQIVALSKINKTLQTLGCKSIEDLESKIIDIKIQIAALEDAGNEPKKLYELLEQLEKTKVEYENAVREEEEKQAKKNKIAIWILYGGIAIALIICFIAIANM